MFCRGAWLRVDTYAGKSKTAPEVLVTCGLEHIFMALRHASAPSKTVVQECAPRTLTNH